MMPVNTTAITPKVSKRVISAGRNGKMRARKSRKPPNSLGSSSKTASTTSTTSLTLPMSSSDRAVRASSSLPRMASKIPAMPSTMEPKKLAILSQMVSLSSSWPPPGGPVPWSSLYCSEQTAHW